MMKTPSLDLKLHSADSRNVIACFVDIRGFTQFVQDTHTHATPPPKRFLSEFFSSFQSAFTKARENLGDDEYAINIRKHANPITFKPLGDGAMLVWECPSSDETGLALFVLDFVTYLQEAFYDIIEPHNLGDESAKDLDLGIGLSSGLAWKFTYAEPNVVDYGGNPINLAARLQDEARPGGVVAKLDLARDSFLERCCVGEGKIGNVKATGIIGDTTVWYAVSSSKKAIRRRIDCKLDEPRGVLDWFIRMNQPDGSTAPDPASLTEAASKSVFAARKELEARFAQELAARVSGTSNPGLLAPIEVTVQKMASIIRTPPDDLTPRQKHNFQQLGTTFHRKIAELSHETERELRSQVADEFHLFTQYLYPVVMKDLPRIYYEHKGILDAISCGNASAAHEQMKTHIGNYIRRLCGSLINNPKACEPLTV